MLMNDKVQHSIVFVGQQYIEFTLQVVRNMPDESMYAMELLRGMATLRLQLHVVSSICCYLACLALCE